MELQLDLAVFVSTSVGDARRSDVVAGEVVSEERSSKCEERFYSLGYAKAGRWAELIISIHVALLCIAYCLRRGFREGMGSKILRHDRTSGALAPSRWSGPASCC